jgi:hypothetical protein
LADRLGNYTKLHIFGLEPDFLGTAAIGAKRPFARTMGSAAFPPSRSTDDFVGRNINVVLVIAEKVANVICCRASLPAVDLPEFENELT